MRLSTFRSNETYPIISKKSLYHKTLIWFIANFHECSFDPCLQKMSNAAVLNTPFNQCIQISCHLQFILKIDGVYLSCFFFVEYSKTCVKWSL